LGDGALPHASHRASVFDRSRHAIAHFTAVMVVLCTAFALVGAHVGGWIAAEHSALALSAERPLSSIKTPTVSDPSSATAPLEPWSLERDGRPSTTRSAVPGGQSTTALSPEISSPPAPSTTAPSTTAPVPSTGASAGSDDAGEGDDSPQARGQRALAELSYPWRDRLSGWTVVFLDGRSGLYGLTLVDDKRIEIYVRDGQDQNLLVHIVAHEIGHAVDVTLNDGPDRRRWQEIRGIGGEPWWPDAAASDFLTGAGDFAESFAYWQTRTGNYRSKLGPPPNDDQLQLMAELAYG
jgi:hypothetical protein